MGGETLVPNDPTKSYALEQQQVERDIPTSSSAGIAGMVAKLGTMFDRDMKKGSDGFRQSAMDNQHLLDAVNQRAKGSGIILPPNFSPKHVGLAPQNPITDEIRAAVRVSSNESNVRPSWIYAVGSAESNWKPDKADTSSALGMMQHLDQDFLNSMGKFGRDLGFGRIVDQMRFDGKHYHIDDSRLRQTVLNMRKNTEHSIRLGAALLADNIRMMEDHLGRDVTLTEAYITYFLGYGNARMALDNYFQNPKKKVRHSESLINSIGANSWMADMTFAEFHAWADDKMTTRQIFYAFTESEGGSPDIIEAVSNAARIDVLQEQVQSASLSTPSPH